MHFRERMIVNDRKFVRSITALLFLKFLMLIQLMLPKLKSDLWRLKSSMAETTNGQIPTDSQIDFTVLASPPPPPYSSTTPKERKRRTATKTKENVIYAATTPTAAILPAILKEIYATTLTTKPLGM